MRFQTIQLRHILGREDWFHVRRTEHLGGRKPIGTHRHDFAEVFFVESGQGRHRVNGVSQDLAAGDVLLIRPEDEHSLLGQSASRFIYVNIAFPARELMELQQRYFPNPADRPWGDGPLPLRIRLSPEQSVELRRAADDLARNRQGRLELEGFLLRLLVLLRRGNTDEAPVDAEALPGWLAHALREYAQPEHLPGGTERLAALAGKCPEHVNRTLRRHLGMTGTEFVNEARLQHAARELRLSDRPIAEIALDCGYDNLGYFYRRFKARFGRPPRQYRLSAGESRPDPT